MSKSNLNVRDDLTPAVIKNINMLDVLWNDVKVLIQSWFKDNPVGSCKMFKQIKSNNLRFHSGENPHHVTGSGFIWMLQCRSGFTFASRVKSSLCYSLSGGLSSVIDRRGARMWRRAGKAKGADKFKHGQFFLNQENGDRGHHQSQLDL